ncbi:MAG: thiamine pyrophosphate-binding protein [Longimicrobiales bacterium]|nr:thiamine pyrophosphate-binding protein [Longimicrobiales bacterium]
MRRSGGEIVVRVLEEEGIRWTFGIPGTHNIELYDALGASAAVRPVLVTDEQSASFMADGAWRASGRMACVNVVPGAGLTHALSGIAEAYLDNVPMLVLGCGIRRDTGRAYQLHDVDQFALVAAVTKGRFRPRDGRALERDLRAACALARAAPPGPVFVEVPADLYLFTHRVEAGGGAGHEGAREDGPGEDRRAEDEGWTGRAVCLSDGAWGGGRGAAAPPEPEGFAEAVAEAARLLRGAGRPLVYLGAGALGARADALRLVELLEAPFSTTFQGKGILPESHPLFLWPGFGDAAPPFVREVARGCDVTLAVGCRFGEVATGSYGMEPPGELLHVDVDPGVLNANYPARLALAAVAERFLPALLEALGEGARRPRDPDLRQRIQQGHAALWSDWLRQTGGERVNPAHLLLAVQRHFGPDTIFTTDSGNGTFLAMEHLRLDQPRRFLAPVDYSCMGYAVPAALGAKLACPDDPVVALAGDGAFLMTGLELVTAAQEGIGVVVLVLRDRELAQIAQFQGTAMNRKVASALSEYDLRSLARGMGCAFLSLERDDDTTEVLTRARGIAERGSPVVVDVAIDYARRTFFTRGVVKTNLLRLPLRDRIRFIGRAVVRKVTG